MVSCGMVYAGPDSYTSVNLKAEVIGLPPGQAALIAMLKFICRPSHRGPFVRNPSY